MDDLILYIEQNPAQAITIITALAVLAIVLCIVIAKNSALTWIRELVYDAIVKAEDEFEHGENTEKLDFVVDLIKAALPKWMSAFVTRKKLESLVNIWFDTVKDILDYGNKDITIKVKEDKEK